MGVLADFVVADRGEAQQVCDSDCPSADFSGLDAKGIDPVKLGMLCAIVSELPFDPGLIGNKSLAEGGEDGPWVFEVPTALVQQLAKLEPNELSALGKKWAAIEEFSSKYSNWPVDAVQEVLGELAILCRRAVEQGKAVLMWMSL